MLKFKDYIYGLYQSLFFSSGRLVKDDENLLEFEFNYPVKDLKNEFKTFKIATPFERARVSDLKERNLLIYFQHSGGNYSRYKINTILRERDFAKHRLIRGIKRCKINMNLSQFSYLLTDWIFLSFCLESTNFTKNIRFGKRDLKFYRDAKVINLISPFKWTFPCHFMGFFQESLYEILNLYKKFPIIKETLEFNYEIKYFKDMHIKEFYRNYESAFPLFIDKYPNYKIFLTKKLNENEKKILKNHILRKVPNIEVNFYILKKEKTEIVWLEHLKNEISKWKYKISFWYRDFTIYNNLPYIFAISLKNRGLI